MLARMLRGSILAAALTVAGGAAAQDTKSLDELLAAERKGFGGYCDTVELTDDFATPHNVNDDGLDDVVLDYQGLICDGSQTMFCGSGGCTMSIYLRQPDGSLRRLAEMLTYGFEFDRPGDKPPSFVAMLHGSACNQIGAEPCSQRYAIRGGKLVEAAAPPAAAGGERWGYEQEFTTALVRVGDEQAFALECRDRALRVTYWADWMLENDALRPDLSSIIGGPTGVEVTFAAGSYETTRNFAFDEMDNLLAGEEAIGLDDPLLAALAAGSWLTVMHGGSLEVERQFPLKGSSAAIKSLIRACR